MSIAMVLRVRRLARWCSSRSIPSVVAASALAVGVLVAGPRLLAREPTQRFLLWNLALAWIPFVAALGIDVVDRVRGPLARLASFGGALVWLFFLPNAPYLVSDLTHLRGASATPWLDLARLVAFAWAGCLLGVASLRIVHRVVARRVGTLAGWAVVASAAGASGAGVALGRFARLNSWEVVTRPRVVLDEAVRLGGSEQALAVAAFFTVLVLVVYIALTPARS